VVFTNHDLGEYKNMKTFSPVGNWEVEYTEASHGIRYHHEQQGIANLRIGSSFYEDMADYLKNADPNRIVPDEFLLLKSKLWKAKQFGIKELFLDDGNTPPPKDAKSLSFITMNDLQNEVNNLSFLEKCFKTLENLYIRYENNNFTLFAVTYRNEEILFLSDHNNPHHLGMAYACSPVEETMVFQYLLDEGYIKSTIIEARRNIIEFRISTKGYIEMTVFAVHSLFANMIIVQTKNLIILSTLLQQKSPRELGVKLNQFGKKIIMIK
jgi:hypothetical protein